MGAAAREQELESLTHFGLGQVRIRQIPLEDHGTRLGSAPGENRVQEITHTPHMSAEKTNRATRIRFSTPHQQAHVQGLLDALPVGVRTGPPQLLVDFPGQCVWINRLLPINTFVVVSSPERRADSASSPAKCK